MKSESTMVRLEIYDFQKLPILNPSDQAHILKEEIPLIMLWLACRCKETEYIEDEVISLNLIKSWKSDAYKK